MWFERTDFQCKFNGSNANANVVSPRASLFTTGFNPTNLGLVDGIVLATGNTAVALGPNNQDDAALPVLPFYSGDPDLDMLTIHTVQNTACLEFDFIAQGDQLGLSYVFASEEYPEWANTAFHDAVGIFLSGPGVEGTFTNNAKNLALVPGTSIPVNTNNLNNGITNNGPCEYCAFYVNNGTGTTPAVNTSIQYDGFTTELAVSHALQQGQTYHLKLAVANVADNAFDSAIFFKSNTFDTGGANTGECELQDQCIYTFTLTDNGGDGLNGNAMFVIQGATTVGVLDDPLNTTNQTFEFQVPLCHDQPFQLIWGAFGTDPEEIGVTVENPFHQIIYHKPAGQGAQGTELFGGMVNCIEGGLGYGEIRKRRFCFGAESSENHYGDQVCR